MTAPEGRPSRADIYGLKVSEHALALFYRCIAEEDVPLFTTNHLTHESYENILNFLSREVQHVMNTT